MPNSCPGLARVRRISASAGLLIALLLSVASVAQQPSATAPIVLHAARLLQVGIIPGPRLRVSGNAIDILGGHEDANRYNPAQHVLSNADYANSAEQLVEVMRAQHKEGSDFAKIYQTGPDKMVQGVLHSPYQY